MNIEDMVSEPELVAIVSEGLNIQPEQLREAGWIERYAPLYADAKAPPQYKSERRQHVSKSGRTMAFDAIEPSPLWNAFKKETWELICGNDKKYSALRKQIKAESGPVSNTVIGLISASMASSFGITIGVATPFVAMTLLVILRVGRETFCRAYGK